MWLTDGEAPDVAAASAVHHMRECVDFFQVPEAANTVGFGRRLRGGEHSHGFEQAGVCGEGAHAPRRGGGLAEGLCGILPPTGVGPLAAHVAHGLDEMTIGCDHLVEYGFVGEKVGAQQIQQCKEVSRPKLNRGGGEEQNRFAVVANDAGESVRVGLGVPQVMGFVEDCEAELRRRLKRGEAGIRIAPLRAEQVVGVPQQFKVDNGAGVFGWPRALKVRLAKAVTEQVRVKGMEIFVEAPHLSAPFRDQSFRANDDDIVEPLTRLKLLENQTGFDGLADADLVRNQQAGAVGAQKFEQRLELKWNEFDASGVKRIEIVCKRIGESARGQPRKEFVRAETRVVRKHAAVHQRCRAGLNRGKLFFRVFANLAG